MTLTFDLDAVVDCVTRSRDHKYKDREEQVSCQKPEDEWKHGSKTLCDLVKSHHVMMTFLVFDLDVLFIPCY